MQLELVRRLLYTDIPWGQRYLHKLWQRCVEKQAGLMEIKRDYQQGMFRRTKYVLLKLEYIYNFDILFSRLVLESPFNNIHEEVTKHPMTALWRKMPWFEWFFSGTLTKNDVGFVSDQHIKDVHIPLLMLHAKVL